VPEASREPQKLVAVIGQGYVGLPVAMRAAEQGYRVVGIDLDERRIASLKAATTDYADAVGFDFAVITVPTPLRESLPDLSFIESSGASLAPLLTQGSTVVLESTTYPGTTEELLVPILEAGSGMTAGVDFHVGYSPERIDPGNPTWGFVETPKVVSGVNAASLKNVQGFYDTLIDTTVAVSSPKEAELTKLLENTFRHVNIALVNELAIFAHQLGVNVWESIDAAATKPFGFMKFTPGPGVGGHCLPVDPSYLSWQVRRKLGQNFRFVELANDINDHMPDYVVQRLMQVLNTRGRAVKGSKVVLVGLAYKRNSSDIRESPSLRLIELLREYGADLIAVDDHVEDYRWPEGVTKASLDAKLVADADALILITDHDDLDMGLLDASANPVLDTRNRLSGPSVERL
jgi:UDP-N-acetyl-D-glucosamine dehydrogenase